MKGELEVKGGKQRKMEKRENNPIWTSFTGAIG